MAKSTSKGTKLFLVIIVSFIFCQIFILSVNINSIFFADNTSYPLSPGKQLIGDIFFTGDTFGKIDAAGCERLGSLSARAAILKKFDDYLYLDFGNLFSENIRVNKAALPLLLESYRYMGLKVLNLTKQDLINLVDSGNEICGIDLVSANLRLTELSTPQKRVSLQTHILLPFRLKSKIGTHEITVGVTGITNNKRKLHHGIVSFTVEDIRQSLGKIIGRLEKADLKILLFNESFFKLKKILGAGKWTI